MTDVETWKAIALFLGGATLAALPGFWKPTFTQVKAMIAEHEAGGCYSRDKGAIMARFDHQDKLIEKVDRHVDEIKDKVEAILIDVETQRRMRMQKSDSET